MIIHEYEFFHDSIQIVNSTQELESYGQKCTAHPACHQCCHSYFEKVTKLLYKLLDFKSNLVTSYFY